MKVVIVPLSELESPYKGHALSGYLWGCQCGESYRTKEAAESCRKCRAYLVNAPTQVYYTPLN